MKTGTNPHLPLNANQHQQTAIARARVIITKCLMLSALWSLSRCAPFVCDMQSARLVGKHNVEITPGVTSVQFAQEKSTEKPVQTTGQLKGIQVAYGLSDKIDLRMRFEHFVYRNESVTLFSVGPKFQVIKDRVALYVPIWFSGNTPSLTQPTLLFTLPIVKNKIEFNPSVKNVISIGGYDPLTGVLVAWSAGLGISTDLSKWAIRPEYGSVYDVSKKCKYSNFSIGLSLNLSQILKK